MKTILKLLGCGLVLGTLPCPAFAQYDPNVRVRPPYVPGELLLSLDENPNAASIAGGAPEDLFAALGATVTVTGQFASGTRYFGLRLPAGAQLGHAYRAVQTFGFAPRWSLQSLGPNGLAFPQVVGGTPPGGRRVFNLSARAEVRSGESVTIGGLVVPGEFARLVAFKVRGASLGRFGISQPLTNPRLQLFEKDKEVLQNDDWGTLREWERNLANGLCGGVPEDAKEPMLATLLDPGVYTAIVSGAGNETGVALLEIFILDQFYVY